jgi:fibronectin type 3 domain-containing protein
LVGKGAKMSEYQYYEFRAIDRSLTQTEMKELRKLSTRAEITPTLFTNTYHWGDFGGSSEKMMEKHYRRKALIKRLEDKKLYK